MVGQALFDTDQFVLKISQLTQNQLEIFIYFLNDLANIMNYV